MKRLLSMILALACIVGMFGIVSGAADSSDELVLQDIEYTETLNRVNQMDSGFTISSKYIYPGGRHEGEKPMNDSGFQFYYLGLNRWSTDGGGKDEPLPEWYLEWLDGSLQNLRANGGACMIRATYALDGQQKAEPQTFELLLEHQSQLASVFEKYPDIISSIECGMIGAFGEMWGGKYSTPGYKAQVLDGWLNQTPDEITINVRTAGEYIYYVRSTKLFKETYRGKTVNGIKYPASIHDDNYYQYTFPGTVFQRIGCYNDAMIQDGNDGGSFVGGRDNFHSWLNMKSELTNYGGEFSGAAGSYRYGNTIWLPMRSLPEFYLSHFSYYHGGNNAYKVTGRYYSEYSAVAYYKDMEAVQKQIDWFNTQFDNHGAGMARKYEQNINRVVYSIPGESNTTKTFATFEEAVAAADAWNEANTIDKAKATAQPGVTWTTGGWSSVTYSQELVDKIAEVNGQEKYGNTVTADLGDYIGQSVGKFFDDHVGYRIVLRESYLSESVARGGVLTVKGTLDNVGFANITREKVTEIVLTDGTNTYTVATNIDAREWDSAQRSTYNVQLKLPSSIPAGNYSVYMRVAPQDAEGNTAIKGGVRFCNPGEFTYNVPASQYSVGAETIKIIYDSKVCANYIGTFTVTKDEVKNSDDTFKQVSANFTDVPAEFWGYDAIKNICSLGMMNGLSATTFGPNNTTTRGQFVTVLYNLENKPDVSKLYTPFNDVSANRYYTAPVAWAYNNKIVTGTSDTTFSPDAKLTREQFATMLYRYAQYKGVNVSATIDISKYEDAGDVSNYAKTAMAWANAEGYITGTTATTLKPKNNATRAQMATILMRYVDKVGIAGNG